MTILDKHSADRLFAELAANAMRAAILGAIAQRGAEDKAGAA